MVENFKGGKPEVMQSKPIFTIGHSNHDMAAFLKLLAGHAIKVVVDVRSAPYSRYVPQFNKREIEAALIKAGFTYIFMGDAIGGKPSDARYLDADGKVSYDKLAGSEAFQQGLDRLAKGLSGGWRIALMCAEENPFKCHRHLLIARELELKRNIPVQHIRADGTTIRAGEHMQGYSGQLKLF